MVACLHTNLNSTVFSGLACGQIRYPGQTEATVFLCARPGGIPTNPFLNAMQPQTMKPLPRRYRKLTQSGSVGPQATPSLPQLMEQLESLEGRLSQLKTGLSNLLQLQQLQSQSEDNPSERQALGETIATLQQQVEEFELDLATQTIGWQQVRETFWQAVRFGGLGVVIGWGMAWIVMGNG